MELIDLYVREVGQRLPEKMREDIEKEIRSLIEDAVEDESRAQEKPADPEMVAAVLKRFGPPEKMAASYLPPRYLIGPDLFPHFITTLKIALPIIAILVAIGFGAQLGVSLQTLADAGQVLARALSGLLTAVIQAFGIIVIVFAIIQWTAPQIKAASSKEWDPRKMKAEPDQERVKPAEAIAGIIFNILAAVVVNFYPQWIGFSTLQNGQWVHAPVLTPAFFQFVPWMTLLWALDSALYLFLFTQGRWSVVTRWISIGLNVGGSIVAFGLLVGPNIVALDPAALTALGWSLPDPAVIRQASQGLATGVRIALGIALAVNLVELGGSLYKLLLRDRLQSAGLLQ